MGSLFKTPKPPKAPDPVPPVKETGKDIQAKRRDQLMKSRRQRGVASTKSTPGKLMSATSGGSGGGGYNNTMA